MCETPVRSSTCVVTAQVVLLTGVSHYCSKGEWGGWLLSWSQGSVVSALAFLSIVLGSIPG